jgi:hypothetical protein
MEKFSEWADQNMPEATIEHYQAWKAGYEQSKSLVLQLRSEILRLHELINQLNHERNIG